MLAPAGLSMRTAVRAAGRSSFPTFCSVPPKWIHEKRTRALPPPFAEHQAPWTLDKFYHKFYLDTDGILSECCMDLSIPPAGNSVETSI